MFGVIGFHGYGYFQTAAQTSPNGQANGMLQQNNDRQPNGSSYYEYQISNRNDRDYGRNGEHILAGQISSQLTTGTSTPALVAQALSGMKHII
jgi:hypothetical protein